MRDSILLGVTFASLFAVSGAYGQTACASYPNTLTNGTLADATQVMANFNCAALTGAPSFGLATEQLSVNSGSLGFNRRVADGHIYNTSAFAYQFQHSTSTNAASDNLALQVYNPTGGTVTGVAIAVTGQGAVTIGGPVLSSWLFSVSGAAGGTSAWQVTSDRRLKTEVTPITGALDLVDRLQGVRFQWRAPRDREVGKTLALPVGLPQIGFIAQDVARVVPEAVTSPKAGSDDVYGLKTDNLIPVLVEAIKEQQAEIVQLRAELSALKTAKP